MASTSPLIQGNTLTFHQSDQSAHLLVDTSEWYAWLRTASTFTFHSEQGTFTACKERAGSKRGGEYWKAYRRRHGKLYRLYLGKSEHLTLERLNTIAELLARRGESEEILPCQEVAPETLPESTPHDDHVMVRSASNLPLPLATIIGREQERATVCELLRRPGVRLLTLIGAGGIGKTRLGLAVANDLLADYTDGVYFVNLAPVRDPALVILTIARTLVVNESAGRTLLDLVKTFLREKYVLLLLDNFEQVVSAAVPVAELLVSCPHLKALVTSRAVLHVGGEQTFAVPPLAIPHPRSLPNAKTLAQYEAVILFLQRAQALKPEFELTHVNAQAVAEICIRLEGLPLAIELAAARIKLLPPPALLARLGQRLTVLTSGAQDAPIRQQTLRATIDWSYQLLNEDEQRLFRRLSIFVGGCTLPAIEAVWVALGDKAETILDGVTSLIDKSMLQQAKHEEEEPRYVMLETIREYGLELLATSDETEATRQAHAAYYLQLAEEGDQIGYGSEQKIWFDRFEREHDNLRTVLNWLIDRGEERTRSEMALRLAGALWCFWLERFHRLEGLHILERALAASKQVSLPVRARALWSAGNLAGYQGDFDRGEALCLESLVLFRQLADPSGVGRALFHLGIVAYTRGNFATARARFKECLTLHQQAGDKAYIDNTLFFLACISIYQGEYIQGHVLAEASLAVCRELDDKVGIFAALRLLARAHFYFQGDGAKATVLYEECLAGTREIDYGMGEVLGDLGEVYLYQGKLTMARSLVEESVALLKGEDEQTNKAWSLSLLAKLAAVEGNYTMARALYEECLKIDKAYFMANSPWYLGGLATASYLEGLAAVVAVQGERVWAARLWGSAKALRDTLGLPLPPIYRGDYEHSVATARTHLGEKPFRAAWSEGRTMTPEQALAARELVTMPAVMLAEPMAVSSHPPKAATSPHGLTVREGEVLRLVAQGLTDAQVANQLVISPHTVNSHLKAIYGKLGVSSRNAATRYAIEHRLL